MGTTRAKRSTKTVSAAAVKSAGLPTWLIVSGSIIAVFIAYVGARGPTNSVQELKEAVGIVASPKIVSLQSIKGNDRVFIASIENPSLRQIQITAYIAEPVTSAAAMTNAGSGALPLANADETPAECISARRVAIARPLVICAGAAGGLRIEPWNEKCDFRLSVEGTTGLSEKASWTPQLDAMLCRLGEELPVYPSLSK